VIDAIGSGEDAGLIDEELLRFRDILGEEGFGSLVRKNYEAVFQEFGERYKEYQIGRGAYREIKTVEAYPERVEGLRADVKDLYAKENALAKTMQEYFVSEEGYEALLGIAQFDTRMYHGSASDGKEEERRKTFAKDLRDNPELRREISRMKTAAVLSTLDAVALRFVFNEGWPKKDEGGRTGGDPAQELLRVLGEASLVQGKAKETKNYGMLPDLSLIQKGIEEANDFYERMGALTNDPATLQRLYETAKMIVEYRPGQHGGASKEDFMVGRHGRGWTFDAVHDRMKWEATRKEGQSKGDGEDDRERAKARVEELLDILPPTEIRNKEGKVKGMKFEGRPSYMNDEDVISRRREEGEIYEEATKAMERVAAVGSLEARADLSYVAMEAFKDTPEYVMAKAYEGAAKKMQFSREVGAKAAHIELAFNADPDAHISIERRSDGRRHSNVENALIDKKSKELDERVNELHGLIAEKEEAIRMARSNPPKGMDLLGANKKAWERSIAGLETEKKILEQERTTKKQSYADRVDIRTAINDAGDLFLRIEKEFPDEKDHEDLKLDAEGVKASEISQKIKNFIERFSALKTSNEHLVAFREYRRLVENAENAKKSFLAQKGSLKGRR
jgi:hypothetical protein